jgi:hypothetical protein
MAVPSPSEWSFQEILGDCEERAVHLERADSAALLVERLVDTAKEAIRTHKVRIGIDSKKNQWLANRATIQFHVSAKLFDWFFNARTGYRAQFWLGAEIGEEFNTLLVRKLRDVIIDQLPSRISARKILVFATEHSREEKDGGGCETDPNFIKESLHPRFSKIWLCERLIQLDGSDPRNLSVLISATRMPKLRIARWQDAINPVTGECGEGLRAPLPEESEAWLDLKGGFVENGLISQVKTPERRARDLYDRGWT